MSNRHPVPSRWWRNPYCYYCGRRVTKSGNGYPHRHLPKNTGTVEHIPPRWIVKLSGGEDLPAKRVLACYGCNSRENKRVQELFPRFFVVLWTEKRILPERRKMLLPGNHDQD